MVCLPERLGCCWRKGESASIGFHFHKRYKSRRESGLVTEEVRTTYNFQNVIVEKELVFSAKKLPPGKKAFREVRLRNYSLLLHPCLPKSGFNPKQTSYTTFSLLSTPSRPQRTVLVVTWLKAKRADPVERAPACLARCAFCACQLPCKNRESLPARR